MKTGVVICELLECLTGETIKGVDHNPRNILAEGANLNIIWKWMTKQKIELGGITALSISQGTNERTVLALLWRFIQKYDLVEGDNGQTEELLSWVKPHTDPLKDVTNFTTSWKDGVAFLALVDGICPGSVDWSTVDPANSDANLALAFDLIEQKLYVPQMLAVDDLSKSRPDKQQIMTYVSAIKNAAAVHDEVAARTKSVKNEHISRGEELYQQALTMLNKACTDGEDTVDGAVHAFKEQIASGDGTELAYSMAKMLALQKLGPVDNQFRGAANTFKEAQGEFASVDDDTEAQQMVGECESRIEETAEQKAALHKKLEDQLNKLISDDKQARAHKFVVDNFSNIYEENQDKLKELMKLTIGQIDTSTHADQRKLIVDDANLQVDEMTEKMDKIDILATDALDTIEDQDMIDEIMKIKEEVAVYPGKIRKFVEDGIRPALDNAGTNDQLSVEEILAIYHQFSVDVDTVGSRVEAEDPGISENATAVRARLERLYGQMVDLYEMEKELREKVQNGVDKVFDEESLLGERWTKTGDRFTWEHPSDGGVRVLKLTKL